MLSNLLQVVGSLLLVIMVLIRRKKNLAKVAAVTIDSQSKFKKIQSYYVETILMRFGFGYLFIGYLVAFKGISDIPVITAVSSNLMLSLIITVSLFFIALICTVILNYAKKKEFEKYSVSMVDGEVQMSH